MVADTGCTWQKELRAYRRKFKVDKNTFCFLPHLNSCSSPTINPSIEIVRPITHLFFHQFLGFDGAPFHSFFRNKGDDWVYGGYTLWKPRYPPYFSNCSSSGSSPNTWSLLKHHFSASEYHSIRFGLKKFNHPHLILLVPCSALLILQQHVQLLFVCYLSHIYFYSWGNIFSQLGKLISSLTIFLFQFLL